jgi:hypothetical protein
MYIDKRAIAMEENSIANSAASVEMYFMYVFLVN